MTSHNRLGPYEMPEMIFLSPYLPLNINSSTLRSSSWFVKDKSDLYSAKK